VGLVTEVSVEQWDQVFAVNVRGLFLLAKYCIPAMKDAGGGSIVLIGSTASVVALPAIAPYTASKGAVLMLARALAVDHAPDNIRVNCVNPGPMDTPMLRGMFAAGGGDAEAAMRNFGRIAAPEEVANLLLFLASDESSYMTGAAVPIDYGRTAMLGRAWPSPSYYG
jgi:NAD(P)-dependent dehydrogenase (short-subunit alcohol dehydrogenase family)